MEISKEFIARVAVDVILIFALVIGLGFVTVAFFPESAGPVVEMFKAFLSVLAGTLSAFKNI